MGLLPRVAFRIYLRWPLAKWMRRAAATSAGQAQEAFGTVMVGISRDVVPLDELLEPEVLEGVRQPVHEHERDVEREGPVRRAGADIRDHPRGARAERASGPRPCRGGAPGGPRSGWVPRLRPGLAAHEEGTEAGDPVQVDPSRRSATGAGQDEEDGQHGPRDVQPPAERRDGPVPPRERDGREDRGQGPQGPAR